MSRWGSGLLTSAVIALLIGCPPSGGGDGFLNRNGAANVNGNANADQNANENENANVNMNMNVNGAPGGARNFTATLTAAAEVPPASSLGTGTGTFTLNAAETELTFMITATGLTGEVIAAHFHRGGPDVAGPIVFDISNSIVSSGGQVTANGTWPLSSADRDALLAGDIYVNLHTIQFPNGEIRGQLSSR
jgi:hypothetical protein